MAGYIQIIWSLSTAESKIIGKEKPRLDGRGCWLRVEKDRQPNEQAGGYSAPEQ
jgi:hypothetical protein